MARREFERSIALNPSDAEAHLFFHWLERLEGRKAEARTQIETASKLDPLSVIVTTRVGTLAWFEGRYGDAETWFRKALQLDSTFHMARGELALVLVANGQRGPARAALPPPDEILTGSVESAFPAVARVALGDTAGARRSLRVIDSLSRKGYVSTDLRALVTLALGDVQGALDLLEQAMDERAFTMMFIGIYPPWRALAREPRFQALLSKLGITLVT
jgi:serine/threonine-protein kinase